MNLQQNLFFTLTIHIICGRDQFPQITLQKVLNSTGTVYLLKVLKVKIKISLILLEMPIKISLKYLIVDD